MKSTTTKSRESTPFLLASVFNLWRNKKQVSKVAGRTLRSMEDDLKILISFLESAQHKIADMAASPKASTKGQNQDGLHDLAANVKNTAEKLKEYLAESRKENSSLSAELAKLNEILVSLPPLLTSIQTTGIVRSISSALPTSIDQLQHKISMFLSEHLSTSIPDAFLRAIHHANAALLSVNNDSIQHFKQAAKLEQDAALSLLHKLNELVKDIVLAVDGLENQFSLKEGSIFATIKFNIVLDKKHPLAGLFDRERSLHDWCMLIRDAYSLRMAAAGYTIRDEQYPYYYSKNISRLKKIREIRKTLYQNTTDKLKDDVWQRAIADCVKDIDAKIEYYEAHTKGRFKSNREARIRVLRYIKSKLVQGVDLDTILATKDKEISSDIRLVMKGKGIPRHLEELRGNFRRSSNYIHNRNVGLQSRLQRLHDTVISTSQPSDKTLRDELNRAMTEDVAKVDPNANQYDALLGRHNVDDKMMNEALMQKANSSITRLRRLLDKPVKNTSGDKKAFVDLLADKMNFVDKYLKQFIDSDIYEQYFSDQGVKAVDDDLGISWQHDLGFAVRSLRVAVNVLVAFRASSGKSDDILTQLPDETPQQHVIRVIHLADRIEQSLVNAASAINYIIENPFTQHLRQDFKEVIGITGLMELLGDVKSHPLIQYAGSGGVELTKGILKGQKLTYISRELAKLYEFSNQHLDVDAETSKKVKKGLKHLKKLAKDNEKHFTSQDTTATDIVSFLLNDFQELFVVLTHAMQLKASVKDALKSESLKTIQEFNLMAMQLFMIADEFEMTFSLKAGALTSLALPDGKSVSSVLAGFQASLNLAGYQFKPDEEFPYTRALLANRMRFLSDSEVTLRQVEAAAVIHDKKLASEKERVAAEGRVAVASLKTLQDNKLDAQNKLMGSAKTAINQLQKMIDSYQDKPDVALSSNIHMLFKLIYLDVFPKLQSITDEYYAEYYTLVRSTRPYNLDVHSKMEQYKKYLLPTIQTLIDSIRSLELQVQVIPVVDMPSSPDLSGVAPKLLITAIKAFDDIYRQLAEADKQIAAEKAVRDHDIKLAAKLDTGLDQCVRDARRIDMQIGNIKSNQALLLPRVESARLQLKAAKPAVSAHKSPVDLIDIELHKLIRKRDDGFTLFPKMRRTSLENQILALQELRNIYIKPGHTVNSALAILKARHHVLKRAIENHHHELIVKLRHADDVWEKLGQRGRVNIDFVNPTMQPVDADHLDDLLERRIAELTAEEKSKFNITNIKRIKINLLTQLRSELSTKSLHDALMHVRSNHPKDFQWLYDGRTKTMMRDIQVGSMRKPDIVRHIDVEVLRLEKSLKSRFSFFHHKKNIHHRIKALRALRDADFDINRLDLVDQSVLYKHEVPIVREISRWKELAVKYPVKR